MTYKMLYITYNKLHNELVYVLQGYSGKMIYIDFLLYLTRPNT
jgi:hypothetical protein